MHAYLIIARDEKSLLKHIRKIPFIDEYKLIEFSVQKIDDARNLNAFIKLSLPEKTAILIKNFQTATEECVNAILKNIEEPQPNLVFIIHSKSENSMLPTIRSRCQIIHTNPFFNESEYSEIQKFIETDLIGKTEIFNKYKKREEAVAFSDTLLEYLTKEISSYQNTEQLSRIVKSAIILNKSLKLNGNVNLHILRFLNHISN